MWLRRAGVAVGCALVMAVAGAGQAHAFIYAAHDLGIDRYNQGGSGGILAFVSGLNNPRGMAVEGEHVYWSDQGTNSIGRANLDGTGVDTEFIPDAAALNPDDDVPHVGGMAVDAGHVYWVRRSGDSTYSIARANLDGSGVELDFIGGLDFAPSLAVDAGHIYWTAGFAFVGRAGIDGSNVDQTFIATAGGGTQGLAVDAGHVYWSNSTAAGSIGRADIDGSDVDQSFITGASFPTAVAVDSSHLYWYNGQANAIGRANLDGTAVTQSFIAGVTNANALAVDEQRGRSTSTSVSCTPASVTLGGFATCTATVTDTAGGMVSTPTGTVTFATSSNDAAVNSCTLSAGPAGSASCSTTYGPHNSTNTVPRTDVISATYVPGASGHEGSSSSGSGSASVEVTLPGDTTAPQTTIDSGPSGPTADSTPTFAFSSDEAGSTFACRVDMAAFASCTSPLTTTALSDGAHTFEVRATDAAGNTDASPASRSFTVDTVAPDTTITSGPSGVTNDATPQFEFTSSKPDSHFECKVDDRDVFCESPYSTPVLADGPHTFAVRAVDPLDNVDASPATRTFTVDTTAPQTTIDSGPSGLTNDATPTFGFGSDEAGSAFECRVDSAAFTACTSPLTTAALSDGAHTFDVRATDAAGNTDQTLASRTFTVDATAPETTISSGPVGLTNDGTPTFGFGSDEAGSAFECRVDGGAFASCASPLTTAALSDGAHTFEVRATDAAGNTDQTPASRAFTVDTAAPDTTITSGPSSTFVPGPFDLRDLPRPVTNSSTPSFAFTSSEPGATFACRVDSAAWVSCSSPYKTAYLADGTHTFSVRATDAAGNTDQTPASMLFSVAPQCTLVGITIPLGGTPIKVCLVQTRASAASTRSRASAPRLGRVGARLTRGGKLYATGSRRGAGRLHLHATRNVSAGRYMLRALGKTADGRTVVGGGTVVLDERAAQQLSAND